MRTSHALILSALAALLSGVSIRAAEPRHPNIIWIMADDLGYADVGCYGQKEIRTPDIDRLAAEGMRFTNCYAGSTVCAPSRSVLMTGQHAGHTRVRDNAGRTGGVGPQRRVPLEPEDVTVAEVLRSAGYATGITGKWGLGEPETGGVPNRQGFDAWLGFLNQRRAHTYYPDHIWKDQEKLVLEGNAGGQRKQWVHELFTRFGLDFIKEHKKGPFFLYMAYTIPHGKYEIPSDAPYTDKPWPEKLRNYAAMVTRLDGDVGRMMALLGELGIERNTVVFFTSDNGAQFADPVFNSCADLRGHKGQLYEGGIRVPMIVRWPGRIAPGATSDLPWAFCDFLPTAAELAGARPPQDIDGISVVPALLGKRQKGRKLLYWEHPRAGLSQAVRCGDWKGIRIGPASPIELYHLKKDPSEKHNVAADHPDVVAQIEAIMKDEHVESKNWPVAKKKASSRR